MKKNVRFLKGLVLAATALIIAFLAIALPFRLFDTLEPSQLRMLFLSEIAIYFCGAMFFLISKEKKQQKKLKEKEKRLERRAKFQQAQKEYYDLAA